MNAKKAFDVIVAYNIYRDKVLEEKLAVKIRIDVEEHGYGHEIFNLFCSTKILVKYKRKKGGAYTRRLLC